MSTFECLCTFCGANLIRAQKMSMYFCGTNCKAQWQRLQKPVTEEWLRNAYLVKGFNCTEIAHQVGRDPKSVWNWLKDFGIETRKRGKTGNHVHAVGVQRVLSESGRKILSDNAKAARVKDGRQPWMKDGKHWLHQDGVVHPNWKGGISPQRQAFYASPEWKNAVKSVWKRDQGVCRRCGENVSHQRGNTAIHHVVSFMNVELRANLNNLILLCKPCHLWVHSKKNKTKEFIK